MPIVLVTVAYCSDDGLPGFLRSLRAQVGCDWRLIIIENPAPDGPSDVLAGVRDERITILRNLQNDGFAKAVNQGIRVAVAGGADFIVLINNDTTFSADFLSELLVQRDMHQALVIAPRVMASGETTVSWYAGGHFDNGWLFTNVHEPFDPSDQQVARPVEFASGCCLGVMVGVLQTIGLLDETFFVYWEDSDFCIRLKANGIPIVYVRDPFLLHVGSASVGGDSSALHDQLYYGNYLRFIRKHFGFTAAMITLVRLVMKDIEDRKNARRLASVKLPAMIRGLLASHCPEPKL